MIQGSSSSNSDLAKDPKPNHFLNNPDDYVIAKGNAHFQLHHNNNKRKDITDHSNNNEDIQFYKEILSKITEDNDIDKRLCQSPIMQRNNKVSHTQSGKLLTLKNQVKPTPSNPIIHKLKSFGGEQYTEFNVKDNKRINYKQKHRTKIKDDNAREEEHNRVKSRDKTIHNEDYKLIAFSQSKRHSNSNNSNSNNNFGFGMGSNGNIVTSVKGTPMPVFKPAYQFFSIQRIKSIDDLCKHINAGKERTENDHKGSVKNIIERPKSNKKMTLPLQSSTENVLVNQANNNQSSLNKSNDDIPQAMMHNDNNKHDTSNMSYNSIKHKKKKSFFLCCIPIG